VPVVAGANDGIAECAFCVGAGKERLSDETKLSGVVNVVARLVSLESGGEFVGVIEDLLGGAGHGCHLRYVDRASVAWMMIGPSLVFTTPISSSDEWRVHLEERVWPTWRGGIWRRRSG
jgi:hypothetical protein